MRWVDQVATICVAEAPCGSFLENDFAHHLSRRGPWRDGRGEAQEELQGDANGPGRRGGRCACWREVLCGPR